MVDICSILLKHHLQIQKEDIVKDKLPNELALLVKTSFFRMHNYTRNAIGSSDSL